MTASLFKQTIQLFAFNLLTAVIFTLYQFMIKSTLRNVHITPLLHLQTLYSVNVVTLGTHLSLSALLKYLKKLEIKISHNLHQIFPLAV